MVSYGIMTPPQNVSYADLLRVWREADGIPEIEHAWLFDHLMPIGGDLDGPIFEGWTMLSALAAQTQRIRLGIMVTSNRIRPPAILAKIAVTVDTVSDGRLDFGIGAGSRPSVPMARREYDGSGLPYSDAANAVARLSESLTVIRRLWTESEPFDFHRNHVDLVGAFQNPKPIQRPGPPIVIGGRAAGVLRLVAEHADVWNIPGGDLADALDRGRLLDRYCAEIGRDPGAITRSIALGVSFEEPERLRNDIGDAVAAGFDHVVLILPGPYPDGIAQRVTEEFIGPSTSS
ncbi:alkanesulfonate monooxygenase SsuD/methylene tetrahydromethanopterin reductase-like flavin-dependent oxidoreductase (luciferase family) [Rhodococcus cercidiphylli]|nr:alkanesulfonate monooxygenase SsuD/methylene tetrahydromethanopterin reductase-like flavin-dependent oxidoreductase (luciferase family) [Rhodococcus cercidiphylli]